MKKAVVIILLAAMVGLVQTQDGLIESVLANQQVAGALSWVNTIGRKTDDPAYLNLNYRLRRFYFSITSEITKNPIVFFGDSITFGANWQRLFPESPVVNRGISGDTTLGLLNRQDEIIKLHPQRIFLMIGTNDLCFGRPIENIIANYSLILARFRAELPDTPVYVQSVLPFNEKMFPARGLRRNENIRKINIAIRKLAVEYGYEYLDLTALFSDKDGRLLAQYTYDGLHLNEDAYWIWRNQIDTYVIAEKNLPIVNKESRKDL